MKTNLKKVFSIISVTFLLVIILGACTQTENSQTPGQDNRLMQNTQTQGLNRNNMANDATQIRLGNNMDGQNPGGAGADNMAGTSPGMNHANMQKSESIKKQLAGMDGIKNVSVIVMGDTALVGIEPDGKGRDANTLRTSVKRKVQEIDNTITNVTVSESSDIMNRMNRLGTDITGNRAMDEIADEFNNMVKGMTP